MNLIINDTLKGNSDIKNKERMKIQNKFLIKLFDVFTNCLFVIEDSGNATGIFAFVERIS